MKFTNVIRGEMVKTTERDFERFIKHCDHFRQKLHLNDFDIAYKMTALENAEAQTDLRSVTRKALVKLNKEREGIAGIRFLAKHECLEILFADIRFMLVSFYSDDLVDDEIHKVINKLTEAIR